MSIVDTKGIDVSHRVGYHRKPVQGMGATERASLGWILVVFPSSVIVAFALHWLMIRHTGCHLLRTAVNRNWKGSYWGTALLTCTHALVFVQARECAYIPSVAHPFFRSFVPAFFPYLVCSFVHFFSGFFMHGLMRSFFCLFICRCVHAYREVVKFCKL